MIGQRRLQRMETVPRRTRPQDKGRTPGCGQTTDGTTDGNFVPNEVVSVEKIETVVRGGRNPGIRKVHTQFMIKKKEESEVPCVQFVRFPWTPFGKVLLLFAVVEGRRNGPHVHPLPSLLRWSETMYFNALR